jgi:uncharacterized radical SAM superfamily protein
MPAISVRSLEAINDVQQLKNVVGQIEKFALYARQVVILRELMIRTMPHQGQQRTVDDAAIDLPATISW